jgi:UTP--glucose-1-phosphate uridylyltransferase
MKKVRKAIFPVGGLGTRFLPATKALPKEMLPIVDKPLIQYAVEEAAAAGIEEFIFVTGRGKTAIEDHFDHSTELDTFLKSRKQDEALECLSSLIFPAGTVYYTRQQEPLGLGHAVWCARHFIEDEPFAILSADDFIYGAKPCLHQMIEAYNTTGGNLLAVMEVAADQVHRYGIIKPSKKISAQLCEIESVIEKPSPAQAPSSQAIIGRYILDSRIFEILEQHQKGVDGEIQLTDAFLPLLKQQSFYGFHFEGERFDCGSKAGYVAANLRVALDRDDMRDEMQRTLEQHSLKQKAA